MMNIRILVAALGMSLAASAPGLVQAKGCLKGAVVGGVGGHVAGHHGLLGAAAGCAVGHHLANKKQAEPTAPAAPAQPAPAPTPARS